MSSLILVGKIVGTGAIAAGALITGVHATQAPQTGGTAASGSEHKVRCGNGFGKASPELKSALKAVRTKPAGDARKAAAKQVRKDIRSGKYGDKAIIVSQRHTIRALHLRAASDDELKSALKAARNEPKGEQRKDAVAGVMKDAAAGKYGDDVEKIAGRAEQRQQACQSKREARREKQSSSSSSPDSPSASTES